MNWLQAIQNAIDHIEEHITEKIDYTELAKSAYSSPYHFQRVFGIVCGITLGEYIRKRRLTLAGAELLSGKTNITKIAFKYGYDIGDYIDIRKKIITDWLPDSEYSLANAPEVVMLHWRPQNWAKDRFIEICLPVTKNTYRSS